ncbi:hypothetical protein ECPA48_0759 [Escherichia coli PA48]|nr:hypothetical protein ECPA48_0759 [Escherichia coli PA48]
MKYKKIMQRLCGCGKHDDRETGSYLQHSCDWDRQTFWSQMRMALFRSRTG